MVNDRLISGRPYVLQRGVLLVALYTGACTASWWLAYQLRFDFAMEPAVARQCFRLLPAVIMIKLLMLFLFRQFDSLLSYFSLPDVEKIFCATFCSSVFLYALRFGGHDSFAAPRAVILSDFVLSFSSVSGIRIALRIVRQRFQAHTALSEGKRKVRMVGIIGAGDVGAALARDFLARPGLGMKAVVFADDNAQKWGRCIHNVTVIGSPEFMIEKASLLEIDEVVIAMPSASAKRVKEIVALLNNRRLRFELVPSMEQLVNGKVRVSQLRPVDITDLLGRDPVVLDNDRIKQLVTGKVVMVTGAGGSIGGELCIQIQSYAPSLLLLVEQCESQLFLIEQRLRDALMPAPFFAIVADVLDTKRMRALFQRYRPQLVFHAAAHKHVPLMEYQPAESFQNNTLGTCRLVDMSAEFGVEHFVQISTDKAINPTSVMGATKRLAELYIQSYADTMRSETKFMAVRFGNVLGSSGSVIPTFKRQIAEGGPVTVTHPEITRYFMTVQEAVGLVLQSAAQGEGGEIFVLDMGRPIKILDVARQLIELSGLRPEVDIEIKFSGLRPGEKLFEELSGVGENMVRTDHPKIMRFVTTSPAFKEVSDQLNQIAANTHELSSDDLKRRFQRVIPEYTPYFDAHN